jgi:hypothetical protein
MGAVKGTLGTAIGRAVAAPKGYRGDVAAFEATGWVNGVQRRVQVGDHGLSLDGHIELARSAIEEAHLSPSVKVVDAISDCWTARLWARGRPGGFIDVGLASREEGAALLEALGLHPSRVTAVGDGDYDGPLWLRAARMLPFVAFPAALVLWVVFSFWAAVATAGAGVLVGMVLTALARTHVEVGADGVLVRGPLMKRFLTHAELQDAEAKGQSLVLTPAGGRPLRLRMGPFALTATRRIQIARALLRMEDPEVTVRSLLSCGSRAPRDWIRAVRSLRDDIDYRSQALQPDRLWRIACDPRAEPTARAGAALALAPSLDAEARGRLRTAADACAEPRLRVALDAVAAEGDDGRVEEAVAAVARSVR